MAWPPKESINSDKLSLTIIDIIIRLASPSRQEYLNWRDGWPDWG